MSSSDSAPTSPPTPSEFYSQVYDLLHKEARAPWSAKDNFVYHHALTEQPCDEWRFQGLLGFGGKYYRVENRVACPSRLCTAQAEYLVDDINHKLSLLPRL
jgi:hypothetical protein